MKLRQAPMGLSNTKLSTCAKIIEKLSGDNWTVELRPTPIYKILGTDPIFVEFADSNQALCKQLRPFFLTEGQTPKPFNKSQLKAQIESIVGEDGKGTISYESATENNLLKYLACALMYKAFLLDAKDQIPQGNVEKYERQIGVDNISKLEDLCEKLEKSEETLSEKHQYFIKAQSKVESIDSDEYSNYEECHLLYEEIASQRKSYADLGYDYAEEGSQERQKYDVWNDKHLAIYDDHQAYKAYNRAVSDFNNAKRDHNEALENFRAVHGHELYAEYKDLKELAAAIKYKALDYKISIHIRFARSMNALNAYTKDNLNVDYLHKYGIPFQETGISDEFAKHIIKRNNLMKLARRKVNRYVTVQEAGIYLSLRSRDLDDHEQVKFHFKSTDLIPVWNYKKHITEDTYTVEDRIRDSCNNFNKFIGKYVLSTYAKYYTVNNILTENTTDKRLYFDYRNDPDDAGKKLKIPTNLDEEALTIKKARFHILPKRGANKVYALSIDGFSYKKVPYNTKRINVSIDILGVLYTIRDNKIAVSLNSTTDGFHSTMWSGKRIQAAGLLAAWNGRITVIDNQSGHYRPNWYLMYKAWNRKFVQGFFHENAICGISTFSSLPKDKGGLINYSLFFTVEKFMELAKNDFKIADTVRALNSHIKDIEAVVRDGGVTDQHDELECQNVYRSAHMLLFVTRVWQHNVKFPAYKYLRYDFIKSLEYDWDELENKIILAYNLFRGKKILFWRAQKMENVFKARTKRLKEFINAGNTGHGQQETEKKDALIAATAGYKDALSNLLNNNGEKVEYRYKAIESTVALYDANKEYSSLIEEVVGNTDKKLNGFQGKIAKWVSLVEPLLAFKANPKSGFAPDAENRNRGVVAMGDINLTLEEQKKAAKKLLSDTLGNFNIDPNDREEQEVRVGAYRLVSPETYASATTQRQTTTQQQQQTSASTGSSSQQQQQQSSTSTSGSQQQRTTGSTTTSGKTRYVCIDCGNEIELYPHDRRSCSRCGHTGCLDRIG